MSMALTMNSTLATPSPIVDYRFECDLGQPKVLAQPPAVLGEYLVRPSNSISSFPDLEDDVASMPPLVGLTCPNPTLSDGIASNSLLKSSGRVADLLESFERSNGLSLETWFTPFVSTDVTSNHQFVSIAQSQENGASNNNETNTADFCDNLQLVLAQRGDKEMELRYRDWFRYSDGDGGGSSNNNTTTTGFACRILVIPNLELRLQELHHMVFSWAPTQLQVFVNGTSLLTIPLRSDDGIPFADLQAWDPNYRLHVFSDPRTSAVFPGTLHQVSLYNQTLKDIEVKTLYQRGTIERQETGGFDFDSSSPLQLIASPVDASSISIVQGRSGSVPLGGNFNTSTVFWNVAVEIVALPQYGEVLGLDDGLAIRTIGELINLVGAQTRTVLRYRQRQENYFTTPTLSWNGTLLPTASMPVEAISYRLVATNKNDPTQVYGRSEVVTQELEIIHLNHPPSIHVRATVSLPYQQPSGPTARPLAFVDNVAVHDEADHDIDRVRVDILAGNGTLTILDDETRALADFESCRNRPASADVSTSSSEAWFCQGDGVKDRTMTFLATPGDASRILSNIQYDAFRWEQEDVIVLKLFDGSGGPCLREAEHRLGRSDEMDYETIHQDCFQLVEQIFVPAITRPPGGPAGDGFGIADIIGTAISLLIVLPCLWMCCCCTRCIRKRLYASTAPMKTAEDLGHVAPV